MFLDFLNTFDDSGKTRQLDAIPSWSLFVEWVHASELLPERLLVELNLNISIDQQKKELQQVSEARELGWRIFSKLGNSEVPNHSDIQIFSNQFQWAIGQSEMVYIDQGFEWQVATMAPSIYRAALLISGHELLMNTKRLRIKECGACTGLYINHGRGIGRRWCRMNTCGNRSKVNRFRSKEKTSK